MERREKVSCDAILNNSLKSKLAKYKSSMQEIIDMRLKYFSHDVKLEISMNLMKRISQNIRQHKTDG